MKLNKKFYSAKYEPCRLENHTPAPMFRHEFCNEEFVSAKIAISGLGFYRLFLNGKEITKGLLSPYISNLDHIIYYDVYDLKPHLQKGKNCIGIILGNGMRNPIGAYVWSFQKGEFTGVPCFALEFSATSTNGEEKNFTAADFKYASSPIQFDDLRAGEWYDARKEVNGWNLSGFDDSAWEVVIKANAPKGEMRLCTANPIVKTYELKPLWFKKGGVSIWPQVRKEYAEIPFTQEEKNQKGYIFDFGVNAAGRCRLKIKNPRKGQKIIMQFGEILGETDENDNSKTIRNSDCGLDLRGIHFLPHRYNNRDVYICKGEKVEEWVPNFTYHGFRYCLIMGVDDSQVNSELLTYEVMNSDIKEIAHFESSSDIANALWRATLVSDLANFYYFPTDCPHREKNGWTGDVALSAEQMTMSLSVDDSFTEWMRNIYAAFLPDGSLPSIVPSTHWGNCGPAWDSVLYYVPYFLWQYRGNTEIIKESADSQIKYLHYLEKKLSEKNIIEFGLGDWCQVGRSADNPETPNKFTSTMISIDICKKAAEMFQKIGRNEERNFALNLKETLIKGARSVFLDQNGKLIYNYQTAHAMAIYYNILTKDEEETAFNDLVKLIEENNFSHNCGILGLRVLFHVLSAKGKTDLAFHLITKKDFPSYGYWIENGATSLWELFNPIEKIQSSCNHHFFGDIISWFMQNLVGIRQDFKNENKISFCPQFINALDFAKGDVLTPLGRVSASFVKRNGAIFYKTDLPENLTADIKLPEGFIFEDGDASKIITGHKEFKIRKDLN